MPYKRRTYSGLFQGSHVNPFQGVPGIDIEIDTIKTIGSIYLLKPFMKALEIREIIDRIMPIERDTKGLTHGQVIEQLVPLSHVQDRAGNAGTLELYHIN